MNMKSDSAIRAKIQQILQDRLRQLGQEVDSKGYVRAPVENLVNGVGMEQFEKDLQKGDGGELRFKFRAAHSSCALAVNSFAWFKAPGRLEWLSLLGHKHFKSLEFERRFPIFSRGTPPNLDVWIDGGDACIAIESKFTEYLVKHKWPKFSPAYERQEVLELAEPCWREVFEQVKNGGSQYLHADQLVKHYLGLRKIQQQKPSLTLLYLYWEPVAINNTLVSHIHPVPACQAHRVELERFAEAVRESEISFQSMSYSQLWEDWSRIDELKNHVADLRKRYEPEFCISGLSGKP